MKVYEIRKSNGEIVYAAENLFLGQYYRAISRVRTARKEIIHSMKLLSEGSDDVYGSDAMTVYGAASVANALQTAYDRAASAKFALDRALKNATKVDSNLREKYGRKFKK